MATKISGFDLFSLVEDLINEEKSFDTENINSSEESEAVEKEFLEAAKEIGAYNKEGHEKREDHKGKEMSRNKDKKSPKKDNSQVKIEDDSSDEKEDREEVKTSDDSPTTLKLADALDYKKFVDDFKFTGTPAVIIGNTIIPGFIEADKILEILEKEFS